MDPADATVMRWLVEVGWQPVCVKAAMTRAAVKDMDDLRV